MCKDLKATAVVKATPAKQVSKERQELPERPVQWGRLGQWGSLGLRGRKGRRGRLGKGARRGRKDHQAMQAQRSVLDVNVSVGSLVIFCTFFFSTNIFEISSQKTIFSLQQLYM